MGAKPLVQGREPGWERAFVTQPTAPRLPQPPPSSRGEMSSGGSDSGSCHCCPWERGRGRDAPLFSPGAAEPPGLRSRPLGGAHPQLAVRGEALEQRGEGTAEATGLALPQLRFVHQEGPWWGQGVTAEPLPQGAGSGRHLPAPICGEGQGDIVAVAGSVAYSGSLTEQPCPKGRTSPHILAAQKSPFPSHHPPHTAPSPSWEEAHLLRQSHDSRSWCFRKCVHISVWLKVSGASRDTSWEIPGLPAARILCV